MPIIFPRPPGREFRRCFPAWWRCGDARRMSSETQTRRESLLLSRKVRRIVVKIGSGVLADAEEGLRVPFIRALAAQVAQAWEERGTAFVVVTSGAIAAGRKKMGMGEKPRTGALKPAGGAGGAKRLRDTDPLPALVTQMIGADLLILLTDSDGIFTRDPHRDKDARLIPLIGTIDEELLRTGGGPRGQSRGR